MKEKANVEMKSKSLKIIVILFSMEFWRYLIVGDG